GHVLAVWSLRRGTSRARRRERIEPARKLWYAVGPMVADAFPIEVEQREGVVIWTIDREARMNSLSRALLLAFGKLAREAVSNDSVRAIVITGRGEKAFCAGA